MAVPVDGIAMCAFGHTTETHSTKLLQKPGNRIRERHLRQAIAEKTITRQLFAIASLSPKEYAVEYNYAGCTDLHHIHAV